MATENIPETKPPKSSTIPGAGPWVEGGYHQEGTPPPKKVYAEETHSDAPNVIIRIVEGAKKVVKGMTPVSLKGGTYGSYIKKSEEAVEEKKE